MKFQAHAKNLRLIQKAGYQEVDKSAGIPIIVNHPQIEHQFKYGFFDTDNPELIEWLKKHRIFSETPNVPGTFWEYVPPRDIEAELREKTRQLEELEAKLAEKDKSKSDSKSAKEIAKMINEQRVSPETKEEPA